MTSSTTVYEVHPDNPLLIDEEQPFRPNTGFICAVHKAEVETSCAEFKEKNQKITLTIFRTCIILGTHMDNQLCSLAWRLPRIITLKGYAPLFQFIHALSGYCSGRKN